MTIQIWKRRCSHGFFLKKIQTKKTNKRQENQRKYWKRKRQLQNNRKYINNLKSYKQIHADKLIHYKNIEKKKSRKGNQKMDATETDVDYELENNTLHIQNCAPLVEVLESTFILQMFFQITTACAWIGSPWGRAFKHYTLLFRYI